MLKLELLNLYEASLKEGASVPVRVPQKLKKEVKVGQIRELWSVPVERFVVLQKEGDLFITAPMTSYLQLLPEKSPLYRLSSYGLVLGVVQGFDYLRSEFIQNYSTVLGFVSQEELARIKTFAMESQNLNTGWVQKRFARLNSRRWAKYTLANLLAHANKAEESLGQDRVSGVQAPDPLTGLGD